MNLSQLTDSQLWAETKLLFKTEQERTIAIFFHLIEIERRRLYAKNSYASLWDMLTRGFGHDEASAQRRVDAMGLLRDQPQVETQMREGRIGFTNAATTQKFFRTNKLTQEAKIEFLREIEGKSTREVERLIAKRNPKQHPRDKTRALDAEHTEITMVVDNETLAQIEQLKALLSHVKPNMTYGDLFKILAKLGLEKHDKTRKPPSAPEVSAAAKEREVWRRANSRCQWPGCVSRHQLETDHIIPKALGGTGAIENLRLLCKTHNLQAAIEKLGKRKMAPYLRGQGGKPRHDRPRPV